MKQNRYKSRPLTLLLRTLQLSIITSQIASDNLQVTVVNHIQERPWTPQQYFSGYVLRRTVRTREITQKAKVYVAYEEPWVQFLTLHHPRHALAPKYHLLPLQKRKTIDGSKWAGSKRKKKRNEGIFGTFRHWDGCSYFLHNIQDQTNKNL